MEKLKITGTVPCISQTSTRKTLCHKRIAKIGFFSEGKQCYWGFYVLVTTLFTTIIPSKTKKIHLRFSIERHSVRFPNLFLVNAAT